MAARRALLLQPDGRADGAELRLRRHRHGRRRRGRHPRIFAASSPHLGNFWVDLTRFGPLRAAAALDRAGAAARLAGRAADAVGRVSTRRRSRAAAADRPRPAASQIAIKQLGTNGGGFFNVNSAHPFENPTPLSNLCRDAAILLIPPPSASPSAAWSATGARARHLRRHGRAVPAARRDLWAEIAGNPLHRRLGVDHPGGQHGGQGGPLRRRLSALWEVATTAASNGSVNAMHDSFMPLGGMVAMINMQLGEVIFGGVGAGSTACCSSSCSRCSSPA
jgi:K+-transporting ATPase ATPase A chain